MRKDSDNAKLLEPGELPSKRKVLVVEDNELNREIAVEILTEYGFIVDTAENGAEALEKVSTSKPDTYDLVLMDVQMPVMKVPLISLMEKQNW